MTNPNDYPRRILVAVTGLSPQIVTETLYGLAVAAADPFVPTEIHLITTTGGAEKARLGLLSVDPGWFHRLCQDYSLPKIQFDASAIHVLADEGAKPLDDIRTQADNRCAADGITKLVREWTSDPQSALHVSIAGGRKTMGFFLGYALSLYGRPQDKLSHVLISEPFESSIAFYYPTPYSRVIEASGGRLGDAAEAVVTLAEIPFVSLRHGLPEGLLTGNASYSETVEAARAALAPASLSLDLANRRVHAAGKTFSLPPSELALLSVFVRRVVTGSAPLPAPNKEVPDIEWADRYLAELRQIAGIAGDCDKTERALRSGMDGSYFSIHLSRLKKQLKRNLGAAAAPYLITNGGRRPWRYYLDLKKTVVSYVQSSNV